MNYVIYGPDGMIEQSNKVLGQADWRAFETQMRELGQRRFLRLDRPAPINPERFFVHNARLRPRGVMRVQQSRTVVQAGSSDAAVFTAIPDGAWCRVYVGTTLAWEAAVPDRELEFLPPAPGLYRVEFTLFPFLPWQGDVRAVA